MTFTSKIGLSIDFLEVIIPVSSKSNLQVMYANKD
jgi:hypothetical protein